MKTILSFVSGIMFTFLFATTATAQAAGRIGIIYTANFDDAKNGIVKYYNSLTTLEREFMPLTKELEGMQAKLQTLSKEIQDQRDPALRQAKVVEAEKLEAGIKRKRDDASIQYKKRSDVVLGPLMEDIGKAMTEFSKANNYQVIFDGEKMSNAGLILAIGDSTDVTAAFIKFYNAR